MERLARSKGNFRILKVDIDRWGSPVANQYDIHLLPQLWLYEGHDLRADDRDEVLAFLKRG